MKEKILGIAVLPILLLFCLSPGTNREGKIFHDTTIYGSTTFAPGYPASVRVIVEAQKSLTEGSPVPNADVSIVLKDDKGARAGDLFAGRTNKAGTVDASFLFPRVAEGTYRMVVSTTSPYGSSELEKAVTVKRDFKVLLLTDKPIYQPGQLIHIRALALESVSLKPASGREIVLEVEDSKGNKVFRKTGRTSDWGIFHAGFQLADELNLGEYHVRAVLGDVTEDKSVTVKKYVLPKFKVEIQTEKQFFKPGDRAKGEVRAGYFFGKPVDGGLVVVKASTFDVEFKEFARLEGKTDADGVYRFDLELPSYFAGQPFQKGDALLKLDVEVEDKAEHTEKATGSYPVSAADLRIELIPESGALAPGLSNTIYAVVSYPDGRPADNANVTLRHGDTALLARTDDTGIARFEAVLPVGEFERTSEAPAVVKDGEGSAWVIHLRAAARDPLGSRVETEKELYAGTIRDSVLLRSAKAIYRGGEGLALEILATRQTGTVYLDCVKNRQTVLTRALELDRGRAAVHIDLGPEIYGTLELHAYLVARSGDLVRDARVVYVNPPDDLQITVSPDKSVYRPGEEAHIRFQVRDGAGRPAGAALGVIIVDESVYALQEIQPGLEKVYFTLEQEIARPRFEIHQIPSSFAMDRLILEKDLEEKRQNAAKIMLAYASPDIGSSWQVNPQKARLEGESRKLEQLRYALQEYCTDHPFLRYDTSKKVWGYMPGVLPAVREARGLEPATLLDPWGNPYSLEALALVDPKFRSDDVAAFSAGRKLANICRALYAYGSENRGWLQKIFSSGQERRFVFPADILDKLVRAGKLKAADITDPWGYPYVVRATDKPVQNVCMVYELRFSDIRSVGPDGRWGTGDDVTRAEAGLWDRRRDKGFARGEFMVADQMGGVAGGVEADNFAMPAMAPLAAKKVEMQVPASELKESAAGGDRPVKVREYFPETLLFEPALITDENGQGNLDVKMADSITTWRLTASAGSRAGLLGSAMAGIRVFQDFFIDIDLPVSLTQNDEISVPVAVYNYLKEDQSVRIRMEKEPWFTLLDEDEKRVDLQPGQVDVRYFRIRAGQVGKKTLTVKAFGTKMDDAVKRTVEVAPDGKEFVVAENGTLAAEVVKSIEIPEGCIPGTGKVLVKIYPGVFSQVVEGLDSLFQMPYGCFEQTSSVTYPNVLVLDYMKRTKQITPEIQLKAEGFINLGYQRLVSYEVPGGGFEWFGKAPAHKLLTAYGLMEFVDMSQVYEVDPAVIRRTAAWLAAQQEKDGSWSPTARYLDQVAGKFADDTMRNTAYITWALLHAGFRGAEVEKGIAYIRRGLKEIRDAYTLALAANALVAYDAKAGDTLELLSGMDAMRIDDGKEKVSYWQPEGKTALGCGGVTGDVETTALILHAMLKAGVYPDTVNRGLAWLVKVKDGRGTWYSTQSTVLAMKTLLLAAGGAGPREVRGTVAVTLNDKKAGSFEVTPETSDVLQMMDLKDSTRTGRNTVTLRTGEETGLQYQIVGKYYLPWQLVDEPKREKELDIDLRYDRTNLAKEDVVEARVEVRRGGRESAQMVVLDLGIPPGFSVVPDAFTALVKEGAIEKYTLTGRQVTVYVRSIEPGKPLRFSYQLKARYPIKAMTPRSVAYEYYNPDVRDEVRPCEITVK